MGRQTSAQRPDQPPTSSSPNATSMKILLRATCLLAAYILLLRAPQPLFRFRLPSGSLTLYSDQPIPVAPGRYVLELAGKKLARSPLYSSQENHQVFICNSMWRQMLLFNKDYGVGGVAQYPVTPHVFLRTAEVESNHLISANRLVVKGDRTLDYFIAHEITHQLTGHALGPIRYFQLPQWVREGYADYVGKGDSFQYDEAQRAFLAEAPEMDWEKSGLYSRFHLLVAYLLDRQNWSVEQLLKNPPPQAAVEAAIRSGESLNVQPPGTPEPRR
jgi:hypothetical protein